MTLKSIIQAISNDKILSILVIFSVILLCTLLYYNLNEGLLKYNSRTIENFEDNNDNDNDNDSCDPIKSSLSEETKADFETYRMTDSDGEQYLIIDKDIKDEEIITYIKNKSTKYINELNSTFDFDSLNVVLTIPENIDYSKIKEIVKTYGNVSEDAIEKYKDDIKKLISSYNENTNNNETILTTSGETDYYKHLYITNIYKNILKILFENKIINVTGNISNIINRINKIKKRLEKKYTERRNNILSYRKKRLRNNLQSLYKFYITLEFIKDDANFESMIKYNLLSNYTINSDSDEPLIKDQTYEPEPGTDVLEFSDTFDGEDNSLVLLYIQNYNNIFKDMISEIESDLEDIYETDDVEYFHVFDESNSIERYTGSEYVDCGEAIEYENLSEES